MMDGTEPARKAPPPEATAVGGGPTAGGWRDGLSFRLFALTIGAILFVEILIFIPSAADFRAVWLNERVQAARIASLAIDAAPSRAVSMELSSALLANAEVLAVAEMADGVRYQLLPAQVPISRPIVTVDLSEARGFSVTDAFRTLLAPEGRTLMIMAPGMGEDSALEILVLEAPLKDALWQYALNILWLSLLISISTGAVIYAILLRTVVRPIRRVTTSVEQFRDDPGAWRRRLQPTSRRDEIGRAQNALADMEVAVSESFRQRQRLAELGEAVARINHDLRGSLAAAQLVSESLARSEDPRVKRAAPRLERALQRAIALATDTLQYGKAEPVPAQRLRLPLKPILDEAMEEALAKRAGVTAINEVPATASASVDDEALHRIVANLVRNAVEALGEDGSIRLTLEGQTLLVSDDGPGLPDGVSDALFKPFGVTTKRKGTGLGLAIARDLARGMGGDLSLRATGASGTVFALQLADVRLDGRD